MYNSRPTPNMVTSIAGWFLFGGLLAASLGSQLTELMSTAMMVGMSEVFSDFLTGLPMGSAKAIGYLLLIGGLLLVPIAYLVYQGDERGRKGGIAVGTIIGLGHLVPALLVAFKTGVFGGPIFTTLLAGALHVVAAFALSSQPEVLRWFSRTPPPNPESEGLRAANDRLQRELESIRIEVQRMKMGNLTPPSAGATIVQPVAEPLGWLVSRTKGTAQKPVGLDSWNKLGRNPDCTVALHTASAGREHAVISYEHGHYYVTDMNSRAGTFVNGHRITAKRQLFQNDEVRMGDDVFVFLQAPPEKR